MSNKAFIIEAAFGKLTTLSEYSYNLAKHIDKHDLVNILGKDYRVNYRRFVHVDTNDDERMIIIEVIVSKQFDDV